MWLIQWWFTHQTTPSMYIFKNVLPLGDIQIYILKSYQYINQVLGPPTFVDVVTLGSYVY